jgi:hypothetical protein
LISVPDNVQPTQAAATDAGDAASFGKLPRELRDAIYENVFESTLMHAEEMVEIMGPEFVALKSLLRVSQQIRHEVQDALQEHMRRQVIFKATCYNRTDEVEAVSKAQTILRGNIPSDRHIRVLMVNLPESGRWGPSKPIYQGATWTKNTVGWNLWKRRVTSSGKSTGLRTRVHLSRE